MNDLTHAAVTIAVAIIGVALLAVLVSRNANTVNVIGAAGRSFSNGLLAAEAPVLGNGGMGFQGNSMMGPGYF